MKVSLPLHERLMAKKKNRNRADTICRTFWTRGMIGGMLILVLTNREISPVYFGKSRIILIYSSRDQCSHQRLRGCCVNREEIMCIYSYLLMNLLSLEIKHLMNFSSGNFLRNRLDNWLEEKLGADVPSFWTQLSKVLENTNKGEVLRRDKWTAFQGNCCQNKNNCTRSFSFIQNSRSSEKVTF